MKRVKVWRLVGLLLLLAGLFASVLLVKQSQDIRSRADLPECGEGRDCNLPGDRAPGGSEQCDGGGGNTMNCCPPGQVRDTNDPATNKCISGSSDGCKPPRKMQNGNCIGNPGGPNLKKCQSDGDCKSNETCAGVGSQKKCLPSKLFTK